MPVIGPGTRIVNAYVGPFTSIYHHVSIEDSEIERSIVLEGSRILSIPARIQDSLIGRNVIVRRGSKPPRTYRLMVGDNSEITVL